jgi:hypothetical protein
VVDQRRRLAVLRPGANLIPQTFQETDICAKFLLVSSLRSGANDETSMTIFTLADDDPF